MYRLHEPSELDEATESLRVIRDVMERSTKHSSLSGLAGILIGIWAIIGVFATSALTQKEDDEAGVFAGVPHIEFAAVWLTVFVVSALTDFLLNKMRAAKVGKKIVSPLGARIVQAVLPAFLVGGVLTVLSTVLNDGTGMLDNLTVSGIFAVWMVLYGLAGCAVGLFSPRPVSVLGWAFLLTGLFAICAAGLNIGLILMAISFGGYHIAYGLYTGITRGDW